MSDFFAFIQELDFLILDFIREHMASPILDTIIPPITHLGSAGLIWIVICLLLLALKKFRRCGITVAISLILCLIVCNIILKPLVARIRPYDINTLIEIIIEKPTDFSFPSGHTTASFSAAVAILLCRKKVLGIFSLILAIVIAFSRLYLYVHFPSDVISGAVLGTLLAFSAYYITNCIYKKSAVKYDATSKS